jgi:3-oxoacyl-(acyl-carrier-protein) synthase
VVGAGVISSIGNSYDQCFRALKSETSGIEPLRFIESIHRGVLPVGEVKMSNEMMATSLQFVKPITRTSMLGLHAAKEALADAGINDLHRWRTGLISATTVGGMDRTEKFFTDFLKDQDAGSLDDVADHGCGATTERIADHLRITDFVSTINTACSSSVNSIIFATRLIKNNQLDIVVAGGTDALTGFTVNGFKSLMILDDQPCRPFDATRNGLNLGEGAGFVVLVSEKVLKEANLKSKAFISGYANTNDAFHQTASSPEGRGSFNSMKGALTMAGIDKNEISYINLHGTGTINNDSSEGAALRRLFESSVPPVSSTKSFTGHTLGACGGIEAVFSIMALENQCVFPNLRFGEAMPEIGIVPQQKFERHDVNHVLSNSFGFGGNCSSIIFSLHE